MVNAPVKFNASKKNSLANTLHQNRDMPVLNDYCDVLAGVFSQLYGLSPAALDTIYPDARPKNSGLV